MKRRTKLLIGFAAIFALVAFFVASGIVNPILERSLDNYLRKKIEIRQQTPTYAFSYEDLDIDILSEEITFTNFRMRPREEYREAFLADQTTEKALKEITVNKVTVEGIGLLNFLWDKHIGITEIRVDSVTMDLFVPEVRNKRAPKENRQGGFNLEGIRMPGIAELSLGSFQLGSFSLHQIKTSSGDTIISFASEGGNLEGVRMTKASGKERSFFEPQLGDLTLSLNSEKLDLKENLYKMGFEHMTYTFASRNLRIRDLVFQPREEREAFRAKNQYSFEIYNARLRELLLSDFDLDDFLNHGMVSIGRMELDSLDLEIFRDKTKPFNTDRRVLLLNQKMAALDFPIHIDTISAKQSYMKYTELAEDGKDPLLLDFSDLQLEVTNLTSIPDSLEALRPLTLALNARLDRAIPLGIKIELPYNSSTLRASGHTEGTSSFTSLNKTVLPAIGLQFTEGRLDGLRFAMSGTPWALRGNLTLLYHDLKVELHKADHSENKTLTWAANTLLKSANPNKKGHTVVGEIAVERIPHKGLANYLWKGVQSGLINSLNPFGKHHVVKQ